jgi:hypothetical protein
MNQPSGYAYEYAEAARINRRGERMNFEQWIKEMSKGSLFSTDEDNKTILEKINEVKYWDVEDEEEFQRFKLEKS